MNPKPLSSLNHFTVPVAIACPPCSSAAYEEKLEATTCERQHHFASPHGPAFGGSLAAGAVHAQAGTGARSAVEARDPLAPELLVGDALALGDFVRLAVAGRDV